MKDVKKKTKKRHSVGVRNDWKGDRKRRIIVPEFARVIPGEYDPDTGKIIHVEIMVRNLTPTELDGLCETIKKWCKAPIRGDPKLDEAVDVVNNTETPTEKMKANREEKRARRDKNTKERRAFTVDIYENIRTRPGIRMFQLKDELIPNVSAKDKEYATYISAFNFLRRNGYINIVGSEKKSGFEVVKELDDTFQG